MFPNICERFMHIRILVVYLDVDKLQFVQQYIFSNGEEMLGNHAFWN